MRKLPISLTLLCALCLALGVVVGTAYAAAYTFYPGGNVTLRGYGDGKNITFDVDGDTNWSNECSFYQQITKVGFFSGTGTMVDAPNHIWEDRAAVAVGIMTEIDDEASNAWIQSSANAKVLCQWDGQIVMTLGTP